MISHETTMNVYQDGMTMEQIDEASRAAHRAYFGQFVTDFIKRIVIDHFGLEKLLASKDEHLNDIKLEKWDALGYAINTPFLHKKVEETGTWVSQSTLVCILKEAARQVIEEERQK